MENHFSKRIPNAMSPKLVSIIIPTYNRADRVVDAIKSVQRQNYPLRQIIVVDDGSTDETPQKLSKIKGIEYYRQEHKCQGAARNFGLSKVKGDYIASLDSDDVWHCDFLSSSIACLEKHNLDFVFSNWITKTSEGKTISVWERSGDWKKYIERSADNWSLLCPVKVRRLFLETCPAPSSSLLIKRELFIAGWNEDMLIADDWCLILEMVLNRQCHAAFTMRPYWTKHVHDTNIYDGREKLEVVRALGLHDEKLIAEMFDSHLSFAEKRILRKRLAGHHLNFGRLNWQRYGLSKPALKSMLSSFSLSPIGIFSLLAARANDRFHNFTRSFRVTDESRQNTE